MHILDRPDTMY